MTSSDLRLGIRGRIRRGSTPGPQILVDSVGMTPVDPLVVVLSPNLDVHRHPDEKVLWIWPEDIGARLAAWDVDWTDIADDQCQRFL
jgi:hypothetical protein